MRFISKYKHLKQCIIAFLTAAEFDVTEMSKKDFFNKSNINDWILLGQKMKEGIKRISNGRDV
jgi:hypothetical protein